MFHIFFVQVMRSYFRRADPFFDEQENHSLIGVANVFLSCLFYDVKLQYAIPIINQKGEVGSRRLCIIKIFSVVFVVVYKFIKAAASVTFSKISSSKLLKLDHQGRQSHRSHDILKRKCQLYVHSTNPNGGRLCFTFSL